MSTSAPHVQFLLHLEQLETNDFHLSTLSKPYLHKLSVELGDLWFDQFGRFYKNIIRSVLNCPKERKRWDVLKFSNGQSFFILKDSLVKAYRLFRRLSKTVPPPPGYNTNDSASVNNLPPVLTNTQT